MSEDDVTKEPAEGAPFEPCLPGRVHSCVPHEMLEGMLNMVLSWRCTLCGRITPD